MAEPFVAPLAISPVQPLNPFQVLNDVATLQGKLLQNQRERNSQKAQSDLSEVFATSDEENLVPNLMKHPGIAYHPEIMTHAAQAAHALTQQRQTQQTMSQTAADQYRKDLMGLYNDPFPTAEAADAIRMAGAANIVDPVARRNYLAKSQSYLDSLVAGAPSRAELLSNPETAKKWQSIVQRRLLAQAGAVWGWEATKDIILGGPTFQEGGIIYQRPFDERGAVRQITPRPPAEPGGPAAAPPPGVPGPGAGEGSSTPPGGIPAGMSAADAGGGGDNALAPGSGGSTAPASLSITPPDAAPGMPGYAPGAVQSERTYGPDGPVQMAQAGQTGAPAATPPPAAPPPPLNPPEGSAPLIHPRTGKIVWGPDASSHSTSGGVEVALSDGKLLYDPQIGVGKAPPPTNFKADRTAIWDEPVKKDIDKMSEAFADDKIKKYPNARMVLSQTQQIRDSFNTLREKGGWFLQPGVGAPERYQIWRMYQDISTLMGRPIPENEREAEASFTNLSKLMTTLGFTNINQFFGAAREAATVVQSSMAAVPGINNTFLGGQLVNRMIEVMAQRTLDEEIFKQKFAAANRGDLRGWDIEFNKQHDIGQMTQSVLSEFGMGRNGFKNRDGSLNLEGLRQAHLRGYLDKGQVQDVIDGKPMRASKGMDTN